MLTLNSPLSFTIRAHRLPSLRRSSPSAMTDAEASPPITELASPAPRLPLELLAIIIEQAAQLVEAQHARFAKLWIARLCLISKSLLPFARPLLYADIWVRYQRNDLDAVGEALDDPEQMVTSNDRRLRRAFRTKPALGTLVRRLTLDLRFDFFDEDDEDRVQPAVDQIIRSCPNLLHLDIISFRDGASSESALSTITPGWLSQLTKLVIEHVGEEAVAALQYMPSLHTLELAPMNDTSQWGEYPDSFPDSYPFSLHDLQLSSNTPPKLFRALVSNSSSSLHTLWTSTETLEGLVGAKRLPPFSNLQDLVVMCTDDQDPNPAIKSFLPLTPSLTRFQCVADDDELDLADDVLPRLPRSIETIEISAVKVSAQLLSTFIKSKASRHPNLLLLRAEGEREDWSAVDLIGVAEAFEKAGVKLEF
ncbi:hypothetical protein BCR35DRAFT_306298 [Leucosporidium creatinivorum]|uniref:F-box domain-containing protein n=1 Tax=Leucosporidium creatinivorum TaxID=106004 RepID=A0A1Y2EUU5_9BASI|nr:hypothetical protein BCR35DRAFT_306298 [Leucosporidium creatinivorum]